MITSNNIKKALLSFNNYCNKLNPFLLPSLSDGNRCQGLEVSYMGISMGKKEIDFYLTPRQKSVPSRFMTEM